MAAQAPEASSDASGELGAPHPLNNAWTLWFDAKPRQQGGTPRGAAAASWEDNLQQVFTFTTVEEFWSLHGNLAPPTALDKNSNYHLFKQGVKPAWEDAANERGGKWVLTVKKANRNSLDRWWLHTCLALIGETLDGDCNGAVVSIRKSCDRISLWTASAADVERQRAIGRQLQDALGVQIQMEYQVHHDAATSQSSFQNKAALTV